MQVRVKSIFKLVTMILCSFVLLVALLFAYILMDFGTDKAIYNHDTKTVNDVTKLNPIQVNKIIEPTTIQEIQNAILSTRGRISIGGGRYSQGGQIAIENSLHLDMRKFNKVVSFKPELQEISVQTGIRWRDIQDIIDPKNLSIKIMQSYSNFTIGGSLSVNVHGRYMREGPLVRSIKSIKVVLADGSIVNASPQKNSRLFNGFIGGYGGLGVIVEATLDLVPNVKVGRETHYMKIEEYASFFQESIKLNSSVVFHNADIYPPHYSHLNSVSWYKTDKPLTVVDRLVSRDKNYWWQPKAAKFVADTNIGKWMRQHIFEPIQYSFDAVQWRNYEASYDVRELEPKSRQHQTYVLREYFVPIEGFDSFAEKMSVIFKEHEVNVLNVSIRHALPDTGTLLAWAREEVFAFVVYYRQGTSEHDKEEVKVWSRKMINAVIAEGGSYYLPYQLNATTEQFHKAYPRAKEYFALKKNLDPNNRFSNKLWHQHYAN